MTEFVSSILGTLVEKLTSSAVEEIQLVYGVKDDREKLKNTLEMIQMVLADAEQRQTKENAVRLWLSRLNNWCYDAEDALDEFEARALWRRVRSTEHLTLKRKVRYLYSWISKLIFQFKMAHNMKELRKSLDGIDKEKTRFTLSTDVHEITIVPRRESHSFPHHFNVIGRNEEKESIIEMLRRSNDTRAGIIEVLPIVGMGGVGKTALAQLIYNDEKIKEHFKDNRVWLGMSLEFKIKNIIRGIIECLSPKAIFDDCNPHVLQNHLRNLLRNQRCLFIMDEMWAIRRGEWVKLTDLLSGVSKGSKVIVTTRNKDVAKIMGTVSPINLAGLSQDDSLTLFVEYANRQGQEQKHPHLMEIGKEIVSKCGGNPMVIKALGSLLFSKNDQRSWEYVRDSEMWQLSSDILSSLRISYDLMPSHLKQCFAYCSIFPKNQKFYSIDMIQLWISNGFIQPSRNNQEELEEIGQQYLEELLSRSFFNIVDDLYPFLTFQMDGLIYELAISVAQTEMSNIKVWSRDISLTTRHLSFPNHNGVSKDELSGCLSKLSHVRTIVCKELGSRDSEEFFLETCISRSKHLRVLWLEDSSFDLLPSSIGGLKHLRFLSLQNNQEIKQLPKSVCKLRNLQTLNLGRCNELEELPTNIKNMISLHVLIITTKQQRFPEGVIGCLTSLRCLCIRECENLEALFDDIQSLTSLRQLLICDCPKLASLPQGIKNLMALKHLMICNCESLRLPEGDSNEPRSISRLLSLTLTGLPELVSLPGWLEGSASTLQSIRIMDCPYLSVLPEWLQNCSSLTLEIRRCPELSSLPGGTRLNPHIDKAAIIDCGELSTCEEGSEEHSGEDSKDDSREED